MENHEKVDKYLESIEAAYQKKMADLRKNYAENKVVVKFHGHWVVDTGDELTFNQAFGGPSKEEIEYNRTHNKQSAT